VPQFACRKFAVGRQPICGFDPRAAGRVDVPEFARDRVELNRLSDRYRDGD
jgi:hypothetical protein